jgi:hypothetical protein
LTAITTAEADHGLDSDAGDLDPNLAPDSHPDLDPDGHPDPDSNRDPDLDPQP